MKEQIKALQWLRHGIDELESATREYQELYEMLLENYGPDLETMLAEKRAGNSLSASLRYLENYKKMRGDRS